MAIQSGMYEHIASSGVNAAVISRFLEAACQHNRCVGVQMAVPGQVEGAR
jgi:hypothetical protein